LRAGQVGVGETEDEELVGVGDHVAVRVRHGLQEIVVVGDPESVGDGFTLLQVRAEGEAFDFGRNVARRNSVGGEDGNDIEEERLRNRVRGGGGAVHFADVDGAIEIDFEELFYFSLVGVGAAVTIAFVDQEFMFVERDEFADPGARGEQIGELMSDPAGRDVDGDHAEKIGRLPAFVGVHGSTRSA
jgi:hypothetical protein